MKNNKGGIKYELITIILALLLIFAFLFYGLLGGLSKQKIKTMKENAVTFGKTVATNIASFPNVETVYLEEAIDEKVIDKIKNPTGRGECDPKESKVVFEDGNSLVTLRCGDYLIDNENIMDEDSMKLYKVGKYQEKKLTGKNVEKKELYNCKKDKKLLYPEYYEELYFIVKLNKDNGTDYYYAKDVKDTCKVVTKTFYREKELVEE